jgi:CRP-like cAMP-binding protein
MRGVSQPFEEWTTTAVRDRERHRRGDHDGQPLWALGPGDIFGEIAVISSGRRTASVVATSPMRLIALFKRDVWNMERDCPEAAERLRARVAEHRGAEAN